MRDFTPDNNYVATAYRIVDQAVVKENANFSYRAPDTP